MKEDKAFKLRVKSNIALYDADLQEVPYRILDDGWVEYRLLAVYNERLGTYVSKVYYMVEYSEVPFKRYVTKMMCIRDMLYDIREDVKCIGGRIVSKMVMWILDKKFRDLWNLI
jgi:hypothetical protein